MALDKKLLGDSLVQSGLIGPIELEKALEVQKASGHRLGEVLVALGYLTESDVARAVANQLGVPFVADHQIQVDMTVARLLPPSVARKTSALPLREENGVLHVAMSDPLDVFSLDEIRHLTRRQVQPVACTRQGLSKALAQYERLSSLRNRDGTAETPQATAEALLQPEPDDAPVVQLVNELIDRAINERASDIHIEPGENQFRVRFRVDGFLREIMNPQKSYHAPTVARIKVQAGLDIAERRAPQDGRIELREKGRNVDLRVSTLPTVFGEKVVLRLFDRNRSLARLEEIGFGQQIFQWYSSAVRKPHGMVLVTGPTGSGKTSTLMSTLGYLNSPEKNIVTIEDPVEYQLPGINHVQVNPKAGLTFADGLRAILRQDPNIIMIGEIRDGETADVAVRSALTGHLVLSTLHTNDAAGALTRLVDMDVEPYLIASSVLGVLAQRLLRKVCTHCREPHEVDSDIFAGYGCVPTGPAKVTLYRARGCAQCNDTGYVGRFPVFEFLRVTPAIQELVTQGCSLPDIRGLAVTEGMSLLMTNGLYRALEGYTTPEEVFRVTSFTDH
ncbi:MAG: ral secretory pathway protein [Symbiobacteriaceae bacterium]|jgi:type IV pilus assembly protein PilB|nr:ral secretory pathway protein [Symbiobacteriaceae bacterium]